YCILSCFYLFIPRPPRPPPLPYTTLFRSCSSWAPGCSSASAAATPPSTPPNPNPAPGSWCPWAWSPEPSTPPEAAAGAPSPPPRSEEHTSELQSRENLVCRLLLEKKKQQY